MEYKAVKDKEFEKAQAELAQKNASEELDKESEALERALEGEVVEDDEMVETITFKYSEIKEITLDKKNITGAQLQTIEKAWRKASKGALVKEFDDAYLARVASAMSNLTYKEIVNLNATDYKKVTRAVSDFLLDV